MGMTAKLSQPEAAEMDRAHPGDCGSCWGAEWRRLLTLPPRRPSLLVLCHAPSSTWVMPWLMHRCAQPVRTCILPGDLVLPAQKSGTLLLWDVATLTLRQQIELYDWMDGCSGIVQVVSVPSTALRSL